MKSMAKAPEGEDDSFLQPSQKGSPGLQEDCYEGLLGKALLSYPEQGLCAPALQQASSLDSREQGDPEPGLPIGIKSGKSATPAGELLCNCPLKSIGSCLYLPAFRSHLQAAGLFQCVHRAGCERRVPCAPGVLGR